MNFFFKNSLSKELSFFELCNPFQVGYTTFPQINTRMDLAGLNYSRLLNKPSFVTFYTDKVICKNIKILKKHYM